MPFDILHPAAVCKILLYACNSPEQPFSIHERVCSEWFDAIEPDAAAAVIQKLNIRSTKQKISGKVLNFGSEGFLQSSATIEFFDARPLWNITTIARNFLAESRFLRAVDFSGITFECCSEISDQFLSNCSNLEVVDISSFSNVEKIGCNFLGNCENLRELNLGVFGSGKIRIIQAGFCAGCTSLTSVDVSPLAKNVRHLPNSFFARCRSLKTIVGLEHFGGRLASVGANFLEGTAIEEIDLSFMENVDRVDMNFLLGCVLLTSIRNFERGLSNVATVARGFLHYVPIQTLSFGRTTESACTFLDCGEIVITRNGPPRGVREAHHFLHGCNFLKEIDLSALLNVQTVNQLTFVGKQMTISNFLERLPKLEKFTIPKSAVGLFVDVLKDGNNDQFRLNEISSTQVKLRRKDGSETQVEVVSYDVAKFRSRNSKKNSKIEAARDPDWEEFWRRNPMAASKRAFLEQQEAENQNEKPDKEKQEEENSSWSCSIQ
jgi:hypothetical protein